MARDARTLPEDRAHDRPSPASASAPTPGLDLLTFTLGATVYGIEHQYVREVTPLVSVTPVPGAPEFLTGVTNYRGQVLGLFDLRGLLGIAAGVVDDFSRVLVLGLDAPEFGLLADRADETLRVPLADIQAAPDLPQAGGRTLYRGIVESGLIVLDGNRLLRDDRLTLDHSAASPDDPSDPSV